MGTTKRTTGALLTLLLAGACNDFSLFSLPGDDDREDVEIGGNLVQVTLPQAISGGLWINPEVYPQATLRIGVVGKADAATVAIAGRTIQAERIDEALFAATLPAATFDDGVHTFDVHVKDGDVVVGALRARLGVGRGGLQFTDFDDVGSAGTPRMHMEDGHLFLTFTDRSTGEGQAWLAELDGAGVELSRVGLPGVDGQPAVAARAALGRETVGVLLQTPGGAYSNHFVLANRDGTVRAGPFALEEEGRFGSFGGDVVYGDGAYTAVYRSNDGAAGGELRWLRVDEASGALTGPVTVEVGSAAETESGFDPFTRISIRTVDEVSTVGYVRQTYDPRVGSRIPRAHAAVVDASGFVASRTVLGGADGFPWHDDGRVMTFGAAPVMLWSSKDLLDPSDNPAVSFFGARPGAESNQNRPLVAAEGDRLDPFLLDEGDHGQLVWCDLRSYERDLLTGKIELYTAPVDGGLSVGPATVFPKARFHASTSELSAVTVGSNALIVWLDERTSPSIFQPRPEIWFETVWR